MISGSIPDFILTMAYLLTMYGGWHAGPRMLLYRSVACEIQCFYVMCALLGRLDEDFSVGWQVGLFLLTGCYLVSGMRSRHLGRIRRAHPVDER